MASFWTSWVAVHKISFFSPSFLSLNFTQAPVDRAPVTAISVHPRPQMPQLREMLGGEPVIEHLRQAVNNVGRSEQILELLEGSRSAAVLRRRRAALRRRTYQASQ